MIIIITIIITIITLFFYNIINSFYRTPIDVYIPNFMTKKQKNDYNKNTILENIGNTIEKTYLYTNDNITYPNFEKEMTIKEFVVTDFSYNPDKMYYLKTYYKPDNHPLIFQKMIKDLELNKKFNIELESVLESNLRISNLNWHFVCHMDSYNNYIFQLDGCRKVYLIPFIKGVPYNQQFLDGKHPTSIPELKDDTINYVLNPGDTLHIPIGMYHYFEAYGNDKSIALNINIKTHLSFLYEWIYKLVNLSVMYKIA
jgi:hypothetical protein